MKYAYYNIKWHRSDQNTVYQLILCKRKKKNEENIYVKSHKHYYIFLNFFYYIISYRIMN